MIALLTVLSDRTVDPDHDDVVHPDRGRGCRWLRTALGTATAAAELRHHRAPRCPDRVRDGPVLRRNSYDDGIKAAGRQQIGVEDALQRAAVAVCAASCKKNVRRKGSEVVHGTFPARHRPATPEEMSLRILVPAFMISELKSGSRSASSCSCRF